MRRRENTGRLAGSSISLRRVIHPQTISKTSRFRIKNRCAPRSILASANPRFRKSVPSFGAGPQPLPQYRPNGGCKTFTNDLASSLRTPDPGPGMLGHVEDGWHHLSPALSAILNGREGDEGWPAIVAGHASSMGSGVLSLDSAIIISVNAQVSRCGGIGRRARLKIFPFLWTHVEVLGHQWPRVPILPEKLTHLDCFGPVFGRAGYKMGYKGLLGKRANL